MGRLGVAGLVALPSGRRLGLVERLAGAFAILAETLSRPQTFPIMGAGTHSRNRLRRFPAATSLSKVPGLSAR
jgi:hypothetical protein